MSTDTFDPDVLRDRYRHERDKRLRADGNDQYVEIAGRFARYLDDPYTEAVTREPLRDEVTVALIGGGFAGLVAAARLKQAGIDDVRIIEKGGGFGGTWYWNRYPGARFDSESYTYGYSFSEDLLDEWDWSEHFAAQPETLGYLRHVAERFDLRRRIHFGQRVVKAAWDESARRWTVETGAGATWRTRWLVTAVGALSAPTLPSIPGRDDFGGEAWHTARWPEGGVDLTGLRVGVIGTGATGVQVIQEAAKVAGTLTVFQRAPNWCAPLGNRPIDAAAQRRIKATQREVLARCLTTFGGFMHEVVGVSAAEVPEEQRRRFWEEKYHEPGFGIWVGNYWDVLVDPQANRLLSDFVAGKVAERVRDPAIARRLTPTSHGFGTRRVPLESGYYEAYNQDNVELVDLRETPIERINSTGVRTTERHHRLDVLVYATGFDAITGAFDRVDITGAASLPLRAAWSGGPKTYLGMHTPGFPNLFMLVGPHNAATFCNMPRCIEQNVGWVTDCLEHLGGTGATRIEASAEAAAAWTGHVYEAADFLLMSKVDSWFTGVNANLPGKKRNPLVYAGGLPQYTQMCDEVAADGYRGLIAS